MNSIRRLYLATVVPCLLLIAVSASAVVFTSDTFIGAADPSVDGQDVVVTNCALTVNGVHGFNSLQIQNGGVLTHSAFTNGPLQIIFSVTGESQVMSATNPATLVNTNVDTNTIVVMDSSATITYVSNVDYVITNVNQFTQLWLTTNSAIAEGTNVLVSYNWAQNYEGFSLTTSNDMQVLAGGAVNLQGKGYAAGVGIGAGGSASTNSPFIFTAGAGGGHGGFGGMSSTFAAGGNAYDSTTNPVSIGSGGGAGSTIGGAGGGVGQLMVGGTLQVDGNIFADGLKGTNRHSGGGAGGGLLLSAQVISGAGTISAQGGGGETPDGGGGGGGIIAIYFATNNFTGSISAVGGAGAKSGGAGTIFSQASTNPPGQLLIANAGTRGTNTLFSGNVSDLTISGGAVAQPVPGILVLSNLFVGSNSWLVSAANTALTATVAGGVTVQPSGAINVDGKSTSGLGMGNGNFTLCPAGSGGGYGGQGGGSGCGTAGGGSYGSITQPSNLGSPGGSPISPGGGAINLTVGGTLSLAGTISANGTSTAQLTSAGGSGGGVWLTVGTLTGNGVISANGGASDMAFSGGGGGGRVAVYYTTNSFTGGITAQGGTGVNYGGAGSVYLAQYAPQSLGSILAQQVIFDNGGVRGTNTPMSGVSGIFDLKITGGAAVSNAFASNITLGSLFVGSNSSWTTFGTIQQIVTVLTNATIQAGGSIGGDGVSASGTTPGQSLNSTGGGGANGGNGGNSATNAQGGVALIDGLITQPNFVGSSGGTGNGGFKGGNGGGALKLTVNNTLQLDGRISVNGVTGPGLGSGGGSGGSIQVSAGTLSGAGTFSANGGAANTLVGGGGGGGRIAVSFNTNFFTGTMTARGGAGATYGGAGTVYLAVNSPAGGGGIPLQLNVDNGGNIGAATPIASYPVSGFDFNITGGAIMSDGTTTSPSFRNLLIGSNSTFLNSSLTKSITVLTNATIQAGGKMSEDAISTSTFNAGQTLNATGGGGGHGGFGGQSISNAAGGSASDSITSPTGTGSRGGAGAGTFFGGNGGGAIHLTVNRTFQLDGRLSAEGGTSNSFNSGGGSGGSVWVTALTFKGGGTVSANGGAANGSGGGGGGGGGGGRVAIWCNTNQFAGALTVQGGAGANFGGAGTVFVSPTMFGQTQGGKLIVDNGGNPGAGTSLFNAPSLVDVFINSGSQAALPGGNTWNSLTIASNAMMGLITNPITFSATLNISSNMTIQQGGVFALDGSGSPGNSGPAHGTFGSSGTGGGGGHGGYGSMGTRVGASSGSTYDSISSPTVPGSGGGSPGSQGGSSAGGGAVHLNVSRTLQVNGTLSANGMPALISGAGGGAGGSLWLSVAALSGNGRISVDGGAGEIFGGGGGGGGGRIAATFSSNFFTGTFSARGGAGATLAGGAGTIFLRTNSSSIPQIILDNGGAAGTNTPLDTAPTFANLSVRNGAAASSGANLTFQNLIVGAGGVFNAAGGTNLNLAVNGNALVDTNGAIIADGAGFKVFTGFGGGTFDGFGDGSGGGYGGVGGNSLFGAAGGMTYGSSNQPTDFGSSGGMLPPVPGFSLGGGAIRLQVGGTLTMSGFISADGEDAVIDGAGGGSGGSIWIVAQKLAGNGVFTASGGMGEPGEGGSGGGGRIAVYANTNAFAGSALALGGAGAFAGQSGTVVFGTNLVVSGSVTDTNGVGVAGINLQGSGLALATTDTNGFYSITVPPIWSGSITPTSAGIYIPSALSYFNLSSNLPNQNFILADPSIFNFGNPQFDGTNQSLNWYGVSGASYQVYASSNLVDWAPYGSSIQGTNGPAIVIVPTADAPQMFFQLGITY